MFAARLIFSGLLILAGLFGLAVTSQQAQAQSIFCPANIATPAGGATGTGIQPQGGTCTNGLTGAFSGAALASQALGDLASTSSQMSTTTTTRALATRREAESQMCPTGQSRVDGVCVSNRPRERVAPAATPRPTAAQHTKTRVAKKKVTYSEPRVAAAPIPPGPVFNTDIPNYASDMSHMGSWVQAYGDYEHRNGSQVSNYNCCNSALVPAQPQIPVTLQVSSETKTWGVVGGIDWTGHGFMGSADGFMIGLSGGYMESRVNVYSTIISGDPSRAATGSSRLTAKLDGPSVGGYISYFNGPFSNDFLIKNDFLNLSETYNDSLGFGLCTCFAGLGVAPIAYTVPASGFGNTTLNQITISDYINYRIPLSATTWVEPTGGIQFTDSLYSNSASLLGLQDGYAIRLQAGARFGFTGTFLNGFTLPDRLTTSFTALIFDDVVVHGNFIQGGVFGANGNILNDEGKVQGEGILALNYDLGNGYSTYVQADVRGGDNIFGVGGKGGVRVRW